MALSDSGVHIPPGDPRKEIYRLSTYLKFHVITPVDVIDLARHGYYYVGYKDRVKCFSCGEFKQDWCSQDNTRLARSHLQGCKLVLGTETSNVPIGNYKPEFVGTITASLPISENGQVAHASSSSNFIPNSPKNSIQSYQPYGTTSARTDLHLAQITTSNHNRLGEQICNLFKEEEEMMAMGRKHRNIPLNGVTLTLTEPADPSPEDKLRLKRELSYLHPVNPHMRDYEVRLQTFDQRWPSHKVLAAKEHIAKAGFFFLGQRDRVKCWYCNGGLQNWEAKDKPFTEHAKWFPECDFIRRCKGDRFVESIVGDLMQPHPLTLSSNLLQNDITEASSAAILRTAANSNLPSTSKEPVCNQNLATENNRSSTSCNIRKLAEEAGFSKESIRRAMLKKQKKRTSFKNIHELVTFLVFHDDSRIPAINRVEALLQRNRFAGSSDEGDNEETNVNGSLQKRKKDEAEEEQRSNEEAANFPTASNRPNTKARGQERDEGKRQKDKKLPK